METIKRFFQIERREINYFSWIIESYDGMAIVKTIDPHRAIVELRISPGCESLIFELLDSLNKNEGIKLIPEELTGYPSVQVHNLHYKQRRGALNQE